MSLKYCRSFADAEDNTQDSFIAIYHKIEQYQGKGSFEGWMKRIVIHHAIDRYKKEIKVDSMESQKLWLLDEPQIFMPETIPIEVLLQMIHELPDQYRIVFSLYELDQYSHSEIAKLLQISEGTSKSNLHRAKQQLKQKIESLTHPESNHGT
ncbi:MAG: polymerase sigma factor SigW [Bacteroidota bacterium]